MSGFGGLVPATLRYSTLEARRNLRRPAMMESSAHGYLSSQENSGHDGAASFGRSPVAHVLELLAALEPIARLLHALQCERGHTSCWVASRGAHDRDQVIAWRAATDLAIAARGAAPEARALLTRVRESADRDVASATHGPADVGAAYYASLVGFASLIQQARRTLAPLHLCR